jgi:nucleoside-diphosphate-sugar epimerase
MRIAILGATSQIAKDLIISFSENSNHDLILFARRPDLVIHWLTTIKLNEKYSTHDFGSFGVDKYFDAIINFVGIGDPAKAVEMGASIFDVTLKYDELALDYVRRHPHCRYIFLSSGAIYNSTFDEPVDENSKAIIEINDFQSQHWYGVAKLYAECRHRALNHLPIVDIRVFNYFSHTQDMSSRFFITDIVRAIKGKEILMTSAENIVRDYIGADDFFQIIDLILNNRLVNDVVDTYTKSPVDKITLLKKTKDFLGLRYEFKDEFCSVNATGGAKINYFSTNRKLETYGYKPSKGSLELILHEVKKSLE